MCAQCGAQVADEVHTTHGVCAHTRMSYVDDATTSAAQVGMQRIEVDGGDQLITLLCTCVHRCAHHLLVCAGGGM